LIGFAPDFGRYARKADGQRFEVTAAFVSKSGSRAVLSDEFDLQGVSASV
jgi:hypothetical protein